MKTGFLYKWLSSPNIFLPVIWSSRALFRAPQTFFSGLYARNDRSPFFWGGGRPYLVSFNLKSRATRSISDGLIVGIEASCKGRLWYSSVRSVAAPVRGVHGELGKSPASGLSDVCTLKHCLPLLCTLFLLMRIFTKKAQQISPTNRKLCFTSM